tara:strand:+ start:211 stop:411 length:201 start_codon:yes stop_codon:yes gene_type:complete
MNDFVTETADIKALKNFISDPDAEDSLKLDILSWMFDNRHMVNNPIRRNDVFHSQVDGFLRLIGAK